MNVRAAIQEKPQAFKVAAALGAVYIVWGSTYLAIRVTVETLPALLTAGARFVLAGSILYAFVIRRVPRDERPTLRQWRSAAIVGGALLLGGNGGVVLAESWGVPSGIAALLVGTVPLWMALIGFVVLKERMRMGAVAGLVLGFSGVAVLAKPSGSFPVAGSLMIVGAAFVWSAGSLYARRADLPKRPLLATAMEMLAGGTLQLLVGAARGEIGRIDVGAISGASLGALAYLVVFGSLIGFTAYIYALSNTRTSLVATYAYVNPVIAVLLGAWLVNERITARELIAGLVIVASVALIVSQKPEEAAEASPADAPPPAIDLDELGEATAPAG